MRKAIIASFSLSLALTLSACGAGQDAATRMTKQVTDGVESSITVGGNNIKVSGLLLVAQPDGSVVLVASMVNNGTEDDALLAVSIAGRNSTLSEKSIPMRVNAPLNFAGDSANASVVLPDLNAKPGTRVPVYIFFGRAGEMKLDAIVRDKSGEYAGVGA